MSLKYNLIVSYCFFVGKSKSKGWEIIYINMNDKIIGTYNNQKVKVRSKSIYIIRLQ